MIWYLNWKLRYVWEKYIILNVNGVWYKVWTSTDTITKIKENTDLEFWVFTNVKENEISLYGFLTKDELDFFELLLEVNWVWPKTALEILNLPIDILKSAIATHDIETLKQVKWIWQKAAERIVIELKNKIWHIEIKQIQNKWSRWENEILTETIMALEWLWFNKWEIIKKIRNAPKLETTEEMIKWYLWN